MSLMCVLAIVLSIIYRMVLLLVLQDDYLEKAKPTTNVSYFFTQSKIGTEKKKKKLELMIFSFSMNDLFCVCLRV